MVPERDRAISEAAWQAIAQVMTPLRLADKPASLAMCRRKLERMLDERRLCEFSTGQQHRYQELCSYEAMFIRAEKCIAAKLGGSWS